ncbi:biotin synthase BioB [Thiovibrio frasassiensis]|uniref:Biotin synthase n=1 Tax=Thiovibrio frasassiensis TaxID=2984131 RepID=A0A9X4MHD7_9BACT|nr:biotin synthase BioB [Thiovibrio frasassiensis]MDG4475573.1 biotin synthase BioB [Thiovibrio frasassiensis]
MNQPPDITELQALPLAELMGQALATKLARRGTSFSLCSIINAKSGRCSEDCRFCTQSAHYQTEAPVYPLLDKAQILTAAREAKKNGAGRFSLVTSGRGLASADLPQMLEIIRTIREEVGIKVCASLGILGEAELRQLKEAGVSRYHHNLETSNEFFPQVCTTHSFSDRVATIKAAQNVGLSVCSGGIFGLGESETDRLSMAMTLAECGIDSVPINVLIPLPGTPCGELPPMPIAEILRSIALYRLILPQAAIRLAAGRESALSDFLSSAFMGGADGMMIGGYLTQRGRSPEADRKFAEDIIQLWSI